MSTAPVRAGVLLSGRGSNFLALAQAIAAGEVPGCEIAVVISNVPDAPGLAAARERGLPAIAHPSRGVPREQHDRAMLHTLHEHGVELVLLAGYMRVLTAGFIAAYRNRILNIHPSLLPAFPGLHPQRQALEAGVKIAGCTVHLVDELVDHGTILLQRAVPVLDGDTEETLSARILVEEHKAYPDALRRMLREGSVPGEEDLRREAAPGETSLQQQIEALERALLTEEIRSDSRRAAALLAPGFREFGSSGRVFDREAILQLMAEQSALGEVAVEDFQLTPIGDDAVLATYRTVRSGTDSAALSAHRSSIWVRDADRWRMLFHQGTRAAG